MLTIADEGGGVYETPILADVICEQPLSGRVCLHFKPESQPIGSKGMTAQNFLET